MDEGEGALDSLLALSVSGPGRRCPAFIHAYERDPDEIVNCHACERGPVDSIII